ncbi:MAG: outer membrane beta-barrel protein [Saprospiraceae bacterium]|nr:outer membrane beta-barrel protein [Saprospiraceae bacterium]
MDKLLVGLVVYFLASYNSVFAQVNLSVSVGVNYSNFDLSLFPHVSQNEKDLYHYTFAFGFPFSNLGIGIEYSLNSISLYSGLKLSDRASSDYSTGFPPHYDHLVYTYTFLELPAVVAWKIKKMNLELGIGININHRLGSNYVNQNDETKLWGMDLRAMIKYNINEIFYINFTYTQGNIDKAIYAYENVYMFNVFSLNVGYNFWRIKLRNTPSI